MMVQQWVEDAVCLLEFKANNNNIKYKIMVSCGDCVHVSLMNTLVGFYLFLFSASVDPEQTKRVVQETQALCGSLTRRTWQHGFSFLKWFVIQTLTGHFPWEQVDEEDEDVLEEVDIEAEREVEEEDVEEQPDTPVAESPRDNPTEQVRERTNFRYNFRKRRRIMVEE